MTTLSAVRLTGPVPDVLLTVTDLAAEVTVTIAREPAGPAGAVVRGTPGTYPAGDAVVLTDREGPIGVPVTYTATLQDTGGQVVETLTADVPAAVPDRPGVVVSDPFTGRVVVVTAYDQTDESTEWRGSRLDPAGWAFPLYLTAPTAGWTWTLHLLTADLADREQLDAIVRSGRPLLVRVPAGCDLRAGWAVAEGARVRRWAVPAADTRRVWSIPLGEVAIPDTTEAGQAGATLQDLHEWEPTTLQALSTRAGTLLDLAVQVITDA